MKTKTAKRSPGDVIRDARKAKGWTQTELADRLGTSQGNVSDIENNRPNGRKSIEWFVSQRSVWTALDIHFADLAELLLPVVKGGCPCCGRPY